MATTHHNSIPASSARRLPRYFRYLRELLINGVLKVSSDELAARLGITPSRVRSDLSRFTGSGHQGYGYSVKLLYTEISRALGVGDGMSAVIIGGDPAFIDRLAELFEGRGVTVTAAFVQKELIGSGEPPRRIPRHAFDRLREVLSSSPAEIAVLAELPPGIPPSLLEELGVRGIWNQTQTDISASIPVINLPVGDIILHLCYEIRNNTAEERHEL